MEDFYDFLLDSKYDNCFGELEDEIDLNDIQSSLPSMFEKDAQNFAEDNHFNMFIF